ncbi:MAG: ATP synthase F1 subunit delta [Bryobacterales bacterium]|nr:ATP synthase F1 subunit delta [Bryobacteraceae bacterium]MDW8353056.1 ATP synthase F1 subunit delta [Bryobacterales bacterium]
MARAVASRYARALAELVFDPSKGLDPQTAVSQLDRFQELLDAAPDLRVALLSPAVPAARKRAVVTRLAERLEMPRLVRNFLFVLIDHRRTPLVREIREAFQGVVDERLGIRRAEVTSARPLDENEQARVAVQLGKLTGKRVVCRFALDSGLIGGLTARIGSTIYDGSVRGQLEALRRRLVE